jgi:hypothetical protein
LRLRAEQRISVHRIAVHVVAAPRGRRGERIFVASDDEQRPLNVDARLLARSSRERDHRGDKAIDLARETFRPEAELLEERVLQ